MIDLPGFMPRRADRAAPVHPRPRRGGRGRRSSAAPSPSGCASRRSSATCWPASSSGRSRPGFVGGRERIAVLAEVGVVLLLFALGVRVLDPRAALRRAGAHPRRRSPRSSSSWRRARLVMVAARHRTCGRRWSSGRACRCRRRWSCSSRSSTAARWTASTAGRRSAGRSSRTSRRSCSSWRCRRSPAATSIVPFAIAMVKAAVFLALAYVVGTRLLPWVFATVARLGSSELFLLAVVATALLTAFVSSAVFGLSLALGRVRGRRARLGVGAVAPGGGRGDAVPRPVRGAVLRVGRDARRPGGAGRGRRPWSPSSSSIAVVGKGVSTAVLGRGLGLPTRSAILLGAIMAQVGEFSFILAENGRAPGPARRAGPTTSCSARPS